MRCLVALEWRRQDKYSQFPIRIKMSGDMCSTWSHYRCYCDRICQPWRSQVRVWRILNTNWRFTQHCGVLLMVSKQYLSIHHCVLGTDEILFGNGEVNNYNTHIGPARIFTRYRKQASAWFHCQNRVRYCRSINRYTPKRRPTCSLRNGVNIATFLRVM